MARVVTFRQVHTRVLMDAKWADHLRNCEACRRYDETKPATLALMCLEGSVLWKRENVSGPARQQEARSDNYCSKDELKRLMRYKE